MGRLSSHAFFYFRSSFQESEPGVMPKILTKSADYYYYH